MKPQGRTSVSLVFESKGNFFAGMLKLSKAFIRCITIRNTQATLLGVQHVRFNHTP